MNAHELELIINRLGLRREDVARVCGVDTRTVRRWLLGEFEPPRSAVALLRLMAARRITLEEAIKVGGSCKWLL